jgi:glutathione-regulated potassium-efflux system ancillary protein KefG
MNKILVLFAHPRLERSRANAAMIKHIPRNEHITFHDLYEHYPDFNVDVNREKELLMNHDIIVWHHPFYWYSCPPLLKQWVDMVLELGWAYGPGGQRLKGKMVFNAITSGGTREVYRNEGHNRFTVQELLRPWDQTAYLCKMLYLPPFAVQGTHKLNADELHYKARMYGEVLNALVNNDFVVEEIMQYQFLNDWIEQKTGALV